MRDITTHRTGGTAPLPGETPPPPKAAATPATADGPPPAKGDSLEARKVQSVDTANMVTIGDPVAEAVTKGAKALARLVLGAGDSTAIAKVMTRLGMHDEQDLRDVASGKHALSQDQLDSLDAQEKGLLLDSTTNAGAQAALEAITSRSDSG